MKRYWTLIFVIGGFTIQSCGGGEYDRDDLDRKREEVVSATHDYIEQQSDALEEQLKEKLNLLEQDLEKAKDVASDQQQVVGEDLNSTIGKLQAQKARLESAIDALEVQSETALDETEANSTRLMEQQKATLDRFDRQLEEYRKLIVE